jgi:predicted nucleic acid-binding protein
MPKVFFDTNIWFYAFVPKQDAFKHQKALSLLQDKTIDICLSVQIINELSVNLLKKAQLPEADLQRLVKSFYRHYQVFNLHEDVFLKASDLRQKHTFSYWDSIVVATTLLSDCNVLYSEDMHNGLVMEGTLIIQNPFI